MAFRTSINFTDKMNGLFESEHHIASFLITRDMQDYLDEITGQEVGIQSSMDPGTGSEFEGKIVWNTNLK